MRRLLFVLAALWVALLSTLPAHAHAMRSVFLEIEELAPGHASVHLRTSVPDPGIFLAPEAGCTITAALGLGSGPGIGEDRALDRTGTLACEGGALSGHALSLRGLGPILSEGVVWVRYADGSSFSHLLSRESPSWTLPARASAWSTARQYVGLGVLHILGGYDHLLFLLLLVLTLRSPRAVLLAESAFTLSHSISFTATALGWVRVSPLGAEACIAVSLFLVALDVQRGETRRPSARAVAGLAFLFGLVHGLGFAGGLREIGLPERDVAAALVSFGAGVEVGQVAFLAVVLTVVHFARRLAAWPKVELCGAYAGGSVAAFWAIERVIACL